MTLSDRPTNRPLRVVLARAKEVAGQISAIISTAIAVVGIGIAVLKWYNTHQEALIQVHNTDARAHVVIQNRIDDLEVRVLELEKRALHAEEGSEYLGEILVRILAADAEPKSAYKQAAAKYYADVYKRMVHEEKKDVGSAIRDALTTPWHTRPY